MNDYLPIPVIQAAEARALGGSWSAAAEAAGWSVDGLRKWILARQRVWCREVGRARREARDSACDEAVAMLRKQLRAKEAKTILLAASAIARQFAPPRGRSPSAKAKNDSAGLLDVWTEAELKEFERNMREMDDEDRAMSKGDATGTSSPA